MHDFFAFWAGNISDRLPSASILGVADRVRRTAGGALIDVERAADGTRSYRYRIASREHREALGRQMEGGTLEDMVPPQALPGVRAAYDLIVEERRAHYWSRTLSLPGGAPDIYERVMVPFASDGTTVDVLAGVWRWSGRRAEGPGDPLAQAFSV